MGKNKKIERIAKAIGAYTSETGSLLAKVDTWVSSGSGSIDIMLESGMAEPIWIPFGRIVEIAGLEHTGKTTLASQIMAKAQKELGAICVVCDVERTADLSYWESLGVDTDSLIWLEAEFMEEFFVQVHNLLDTVAVKAPDTPVVLLWDSLGQTPTHAEMNVKIDKKTGKFKTPQMMAAARVVAENIRRINARIKQTNTCFLVINQLYSKPVMFGDPWESYGGRRLRFASTIRLRLMPRAVIKESDEPIGRWIDVHLIKTKLSGGSFKKVSVPLLHNVGFSDAYEIYLNAKGNKSIVSGFKRKRRSSWMTWQPPGGGEEVNFQGWAGFLDKVVPHPEYPRLSDEFFGLYEVEEYDEDDWDEEEDDE